MDSCTTAAWVQALATPLALLILAFTVRAGVQAKRTDVLIASHARFDALMRERGELLHALAQQKNPHSELIEIQLRAWGGRFWSLQFDQFLWWRHGFVDPEVFHYWMLSRYSELNRTVISLSNHEKVFHAAVYERCWTLATQSWAKPPKNDFVEFVGLVRNDKIMEAKRRYGPSLRRRIGLW
jgi:hypothetical protein